MCRAEEAQAAQEAEKAQNSNTDGQTEDSSSTPAPQKKFTAWGNPVKG